MARLRDQRSLPTTLARVKTSSNLISPLTSLNARSRGSNSHNINPKCNCNRPTRSARRDPPEHHPTTSRQRAPRLASPDSLPTHNPQSLKPPREPDFLTTQNSRDIGLVETPPRAKAVRGALPIRRLRRHNVRAASTTQHRRPTTASDSRTKSRLAVPGQPRSKQESSPFSRALTLM